MRKFRFMLIGVAALLILVQLALFDYGDWRWSENWGGLAVILAMLLTLLSSIQSNRQEKRQQLKEEQSQQ